MGEFHHLNGPEKTSKFFQQVCREFGMKNFISAEEKERWIAKWKGWRGQFQQDNGSVQGVTETTSARGSDGPGYQKSIGIPTKSN